MRTNHSAELSRRDAIALLGASLCAGFASPLRAQTSQAAMQSRFTSVQKVTFPPGTIVRTILKDIHPDTLSNGATLFHEHLTAGGNVDVSVEEVKAAGFDGVSCLVDSVTGRRTPQNVETIRQIATQSGVHIIAGGGYLQDRSLETSKYPPEVVQMSEDQLAEQFYQDATAQRWGAFGEIGTSPEMQADERKVLRAISKAHLRTGLSIFTHTPHSSCPACALEQLDTFEKNGVNPRSV